jgi:hypothetical protein
MDIFRGKYAGANEVKMRSQSNDCGGPRGREIKDFLLK